MHPAYTWTNSYPHHANPMHYAPIDERKTIEIMPHTKMYPSIMSTPCQHPYPFVNYSYPVPHEYHGCCNHGYFGGGPYSFRPPYPHYPLPPPPPCDTHGFHPVFPGAFPGYYIPPPDYSVEQPRYDYDKNNHHDHRCCGCNHQEDDKKSKIGQREPEVDKKRIDSLVPEILKDCPYPVTWVPPGYTKTEPKATEKEKNTPDPVSLNLLEPSKQCGNGQRSQDQHDEDGKHFPFPIFWLPSKNNEAGNKAKENNLDLVAQMDLPDDTKRQTRKNDEGSGNKAESEMSTKHAVQKVIPVKQLDTTEAKKTPKVIEMKLKPDSVEKADDGREGMSSRKTSKLPPVCLRIDPLPRKKGSSRSLSPPADKQRSKGSPLLAPLDSSKSAQQQTQLSEYLKNKEKSEGDIKTIKVNNDVNVAEKVSVADPCENNPRCEGNESGEGMVCKVEKKKKLSEDEAALIIQSAYRGFEVRKSQPLTKLRQINGVKKNVVDLRKHIQDLGSSSSAICIDDKQKLIIGETIMSLLLKLDTIQGLHPIVRDVRKSLAKELVGLQEKLDYLTSVKSETPSEESMSSTEYGTSAKPVGSSSGLCEAHELPSTISQQHDGVVKMHNEKSTEGLNGNQIQESVEDKQSIGEAINKKFDQVLVQSDRSREEAVELDTCVLKDHQVEDTSSVQESHDIKLDHPIEQSTEDHKNDQPQPQMSTEIESPVDNVGTNIQFVVFDDGGENIGDINLDTNVESGSQYDTAVINNNQFEMSETKQPVGQEKSDQTQIDESDSNLEARQVESCEVKDTNSVHEDHDIKFKKPVEQESKELISHQIQMSVETESPLNGVEKISDHGNSIEFSEVYDSKIELQVESRSQQGTVELTHNQLEMSENDPPVQEEKFDQMQSQLESDHVENAVDLKENQDDDKVKTCEGELDNEPCKMLADAMVEDEVSIEGINGVQEDFVVSTEEAPKVDDVDSCTEGLMEDLGGSLPLSPTGGCVSANSDRKLMEENEKLWVAVEELMKAGNEQLGVIRELTGKVTHLEKKLSKKKKIKVNKCRSRAGSVVDNELKSYIV